MNNIGEYEATYTDSGINITVPYYVYDDGRVLVIPSADYQWVHISDLPSKVRDSLALEERVDTVRDDLEKAVKGMSISQLKTYTNKHTTGIVRVQPRNYERN